MRFFVLAVFTLLFVFQADAQFPQMRRAEQRMEQLRKADEERQKAREDEDLAAIGVPRPKPAVMNVDVQAVLATRDAPTFAEAKRFTAVKVADGEPVWLFVRFNGKLGDYVLTERDPENGGQFRYLLFAEAGPQNDVTATTRYVLEFTKEDLAKTEFKINLAPGLTGRNTSSPFFIESAGTRQPGIWNNELRITNSTALPRGPKDNLAVTAVKLALPGGPVKYARMRADYGSMIIRGSSNPAVLPAGGEFYSLPIKTAVTARLRGDGIMPVRFYFASNGWMEYGPSVMHPQRMREVTAVATYRKDAGCSYATVRYLQTFDVMAGRWSDGSVEVVPGLPLDCSYLE